MNGTVKTHLWTGNLTIAIALHATYSVRSTMSAGIGTHPWMQQPVAVRCKDFNEGAVLEALVLRLI